MIKRRKAKIKEINLITKSIPDVLQYFIAGYWFLVIFTYLTSKKIDSKIKLIMSCVLSYIFVSLITTVNAFLFKSKLLELPLVMSGISIILATVLAVLTTKTFLSQWFKALMKNFVNKSPNDDIWRDVFDYKNGTNLKVYLKETPYYIIGHYITHEEKDDKSWFALSAYSKIDKNTGLNYKNEPDYRDREEALITIRLDNIEHIEVF